MHRTKSIELLIAVSLLTASFSYSAVGQINGQDLVQGDEVRYQGRTVAEWISDWESTDSNKSGAAKRAIIAIGQPAVAELMVAVKKGGRPGVNAVQTLTEMGPAAREALPMFLEIAGNPATENPPNWSASPLRDFVLSGTRGMSWAADEWIPVLDRLANSAGEQLRIRQMAIAGLGEMGEAARAKLEPLAANPDNEVRSTAIDSLARLAANAGRSRADYYGEIVLRNPFDVNVPEYLARMQGRYNNGSLNPTTQQVKTLIRQRLATEPSAELAFALATIIRNGLSATDLEFAAPSDSYRSKYDREDPADSYATLATALEICLANAPKDSNLAMRSARSLARLRLLQGDWDAMNAAIAKIGQEPIPAGDRPNLPAPPFDWSNLRQNWQPADESMRTGAAAIELQFEKEGKPLAGAHVLIKRRPPPADETQMRRSSGINAATLLYATQPLESEPYDAFGYRVADRAMTRYAVSDATGKVRIERLPAGPIVVEVLVPSANFPEAGQAWDLLMELAPGELHPTWMQPSGPRGRRGETAPPPRPGDRTPLPSVDRREGPAVVELKDGETLKYPKFVVRPQLLLNVAEWSAVDANYFVLRWQATAGDDAFDHYEVEMILVGPQQLAIYQDTQRAIRSTVEESIDSQFPVGNSGVRGQRLRPGNIYLFEVRAIDRQNKLLARLPRKYVYVPWAHRNTAPPHHESGASERMPVFDGVGWRSGVRVAGNPLQDIRELISIYLAKDGNQFEREYVELGRAWLKVLDGDAAGGRQELERLVKDLPSGNLVRGTARSLLEKLDAGQTLPTRLDFVADE